MNFRRRWIAFLTGATLFAVPASAFAQTEPARVTYTVIVAQMKFGAVPNAIRVGDTIQWVNNDIFLHSATAADRSFDVELKPHNQVRTTFNKPGVYPFACHYHPGMKGVIVVLAK